MSRYHRRERHERLARSRRETFLADKPAGSRPGATKDTCCPQSTRSRTNILPRYGEVFACASLPPSWGIGMYIDCCVSYGCAVCIHAAAHTSRRMEQRCVRMSRSARRPARLHVDYRPHQSSRPGGIESNILFTRMVLSLLLSSLYLTRGCRISLNTLFVPPRRSDVDWTMYIIT